MNPPRVEASAPTRIDLAGGTVDIWPLYLLHDRPLTVNAAIDLAARAVVEPVGGSDVELVSVDRGERYRTPSVPDLVSGIATAPAPLEFVARLAAHFLGPDRPGGAARVAGGCRITTDCRAPAGSGLGGSSALGIALASALNRFVGGRHPAELILPVTRAIETRTLRIPTGEQDYHPALNGGPLALHYDVDGTRVERLSTDLNVMRDRTVLIYTGRSRSSGISNWDVLKRHLDGDRQVHDAMAGVIEATRALREALVSGDPDGVGAALGREWESRRRLSPAVTDETIDRLIGAGLDAGAQAGKVCGAGGGGCVVLWVGKGRREEVSRRLAALGAEILEFRYSSGGVRITES